MKTKLENHRHRTTVPDYQKKRQFCIYSNKPLNNDEIIEAIKDRTRHVSTTHRLHPEYGIVYETVDVHFCAVKENVG